VQQLELAWFLANVTGTKSLIILCVYFLVFTLKFNILIIDIAAKEQQSKSK